MIESNVTCRKLISNLKNALHEIDITGLGLERECDCQGNYEACELHGKDVPYFFVCFGSFRLP